VPFRSNGPAAARRRRREVDPPDAAPVAGVAGEHAVSLPSASGAIDPGVCGLRGPPARSLAETTVAVPRKRSTGVVSRAFQPNMAACIANGRLVWIAGAGGASPPWASFTSRAVDVVEVRVVDDRPDRQVVVIDDLRDPLDLAPGSMTPRPWYRRTRSPSSCTGRRRQRRFLATTWANSSVQPPETKDVTRRVIT
jgi:hypothetical protein